MPFLTLLILCRLFPTPIAPSSTPAERFAAVQQHFHQYVDEGLLAGTSILLSQGDQVFRDVYGVKDLETQQPIDAATIFRLASMTKPITSVAVLMLMEQGKLRLDDPVEKYIPAFRKIKVYESEHKKVRPESTPTIGQLLSHTGGVSSGLDASPAGRLCAEAIAQAEPKNLEELVDVLAHSPLAFQPGKGWAYSYSTDLLAYIVEQVSGQPIERFFQEQIFEPLGMTQTAFQVSEEDLAHFATLYGYNEQGQLKVIDQPQHSPYTDGRYFPRGNGGLTSTIGDYQRFAQMLANAGELNGRRLLQAETVRLMRQNHLPTELLPIRINGPPMPGWGFGLGVGVLTDASPIGHPGEYFWPGAAFTYFFINPKTRAVGIFMTQLSDLSKMNILFEFHQLAGAVF
ncbi:MAG: beta-lactamase family protein [Phaeodactylibacter sp.]|nr:beta-lactamase family protein [Phaeodactylibacter sp.]